MPLLVPFGNSSVVCVCGGCECNMRGIYVVPRRGFISMVCVWWCESVLVVIVV